MGERIRSLGEPILTDRGLELVDVEFQREGRGWTLRLYMDRAGGVRSRGRRRFRWAGHPFMQVLWYEAAYQTPRNQPSGSESDRREKLWGMPSARIEKMVSALWALRGQSEGAP